MRTRKIFLAVTIIVTIVMISFRPQCFSQSNWPETPIDQAANELEKLVDAWDRGDYLVALKGFERIISGSSDEAIFERIALITGSLFRITELAPDGRNPRFSPDGNYLAIDYGPRQDPGILIYKTSPNYKKIADIKGLRGLFSPADHLMAYLQMPESEEIARIRKDLAQLNNEAAPDRAKIFSLQAQLTLAEAREAKIVLKDLENGQERQLDPGSLLKGEFVFSADGRKIFLVGSEPEETGANQIYSLPVDGPGSSSLTPLTQGPGYKTNPVAAPGGRFLLYANSLADPFGRQAQTPRRSESGQSDPSSQAQSMPGAQPKSPADQFPRRQSRSFSLLDLRSGQVKTYEGSSPVISPRGDSLVFIGREGNENVLTLIKLDETFTSTVLKKTQVSIASPFYSPDAGKLALEMSVDNNNEIFIIDFGTKEEKRVTREIQHDRQPRFLMADKLIAIKGEPRHSRSFLYELKTGKAMRLFHNETIRTIAPEYEWAIHPEGKAMVVVADYDGDTISPERGVYLLDFSDRITKEDLLLRLRNQYKQEAALRAKAEEFIRPMEGQIKKVIANISRRRLYEYQKTLFDFDSKHVSQPGNLKAIEYLQKTFTSFGYEPELQWLPDRPYKTANVVATLKGIENPDLYYVLSSHFDSVARGPGADDNSSSTAILLETARVLARYPLPSSLIFAAFTGEESGLWGSREFARRAKEKNFQVLGAINNDTIGWTEDHRLDNTIRYASAGLRDLMHAASIGFSRMVTYDSHYIKSTDAVPLFEAFGNVVSGLGSYPVLGSPYYHTSLDRLEVVNQELIEEATKFMVATVMMMVSSPSPVREIKASRKEDGTIEISWLPNPEKGIDHYIVTCQLEDKGQVIRKKVRSTQTSFKIADLIDLIKGSPSKEGDLQDKKFNLKISVRAVNRLGLPGWDESTIVLPGHESSP